MRLNGFQLQQAIRAAQQERDLAATRFAPSLIAFPGENKPKPDDISRSFAENEIRVAKLQEAQAMFNLTVKVKVLDEKMSLMEAIKRVGGAGRLEKMWRSAASEKSDRYGGYNQDTRAADSIVAQRTVTFDAANEHRRSVSKVAAALRAAIQFGNSESIDLNVDIPRDWLTV